MPAKRKKPDSGFKELLNEMSFIDMSKRRRQTRADTRTASFVDRIAAIPASDATLERRLSNLVSESVPVEAKHLGNIKECVRIMKQMKKAAQTFRQKEARSNRLAKQWEASVADMKRLSCDFGENTAMQLRLDRLQESKQSKSECVRLIRKSGTLFSEWQAVEDERIELVKTLQMLSNKLRRCSRHCRSGSCK